MGPNAPDPLSLSLSLSLSLCGEYKERLTKEGATLGRSGTCAWRTTAVSRQIHVEEGWRSGYYPTLQKMHTNKWYRCSMEKQLGSDLIFHNMNTRFSPKSQDRA